MNLRNTARKGFTLIELLVVISIIGLLASIILVALQSARGKAQIGKAIVFDDDIYQTYGTDAIADWTFNGNGLDSSNAGYHNNLTMSGYATYSTQQTYNGAQSLVVPGDDGFMATLNNPVGLSPKAISISLWAYISVPGNWHDLVKHNWCNAGGWDLYTDTLDGTPSGASQVQFGVSDGSTGCLPSDLLGTIIPTGQWFNTVAVYDGTVVKLYVDGTSAGKVGDPGITLDTISPITIGSSPGGTDYIQNLKIYPEALPLAAIQKIYAEGAAKYGLAVK